MPKHSRARTAPDGLASPAASLAVANTASDLVSADSIPASTHVAALSIRPHTTTISPCPFGFNRPRYATAASVVRWGVIVFFELVSLPNSFSNSHPTIGSLAATATRPALAHWAGAKRHVVPFLRTPSHAPGSKPRAAPLDKDNGLDLGHAAADQL